MEFIFEAILGTQAYGSIYVAFKSCIYVGFARTIRNQPRYHKTPGLASRLHEHQNQLTKYRSGSTKIPDNKRYKQLATGPGEALMILPLRHTTEQTHQQDERTAISWVGGKANNTNPIGQFRLTQNHRLRVLGLATTKAKRTPQTRQQRHTKWITYDKPKPEACHTLLTNHRSRQA